MKVKNNAMRRVMYGTRLLVLIALPLGGFAALVRGQASVESGRAEVSRLAALAKQLSKETVKVNRKAGFELAAHVLSAHSGIPNHELLLRGEGVKTLAPLAIVAR